MSCCQREVTLEVEDVAGKVQVAGTAGGSYTLHVAGSGRGAGVPGVLGAAALPGLRRRRAGGGGGARRLLLHQPVLQTGTGSGLTLWPACLASRLGHDGCLVVQLRTRVRTSPISVLASGGIHRRRY